MVTTFIIDGLKEAKKLKLEITQEVQALDVKPGLAVVRVGDDPASQIYVEKKGQDAHEVGFYFEEHALPKTASQEDVLQVIQRLNQDPWIHGLILQLPLPEHLDPFALVSAIDPKKDVDGLHPFNAGLLAQGRNEGMVPCTPLGCVHLIKTVTPHLAGMRAVVVGRSILVGRPLALLLTQENATVRLAHSQTQDLPKLLNDADLVIAAMGKPNFIQGHWLKKEAIVIDVGINRITLPDGQSQLTGDVNFESCLARVRAITPVPGGVGPMTRIYLLKNTLRAMEHLKSWRIHPTF